MRVRFISICLAAVMLLLCACGSETANQNSESEQAQDSSISFRDEDNGSANEEGSEEGEWGKTTRKVITNKTAISYAYINVPLYSGYGAGSASYAPQDDGTAVILDGYVLGISSETDDLSDFFPAYESQIFEVYKSLYNISYADPSIEVKNEDFIEINGYEMYKFTAVHKYTYKEELCEREFAGYATKLKSNGAVFYWLVVDEQGVGNLDDLLISHADNMAKTLNDEAV